MDGEVYIDFDTPLDMLEAWNGPEVTVDKGKEIPTNQTNKKTFTFRKDACPDVVRYCEMGDIAQPLLPSLERGALDPRLSCEYVDDSEDNVVRGREREMSHFIHTSNVLCNLKEVQLGLVWFGL